MSVDDSRRAQRIDTLRTAQQRRSAEKRERVKAAITDLAKEDAPLTIASIARAAGVSTWMLYNVPDLADLARTARSRRSVQGDRGMPAGRRQVNGAVADLALAMDRVKKLRSENEKLRKRLQHALGAQIEQTDYQDLVQRIAALERESDAVRRDRDSARQLLAAETQRSNDLEEQLEAARSINRDLIHLNNRTN